MCPVCLATLTALVATSVLHLLSSLSLQTGYRHSDLSVVYPIAPGTGPPLLFIGAGLLLGGSPTARSCYATRSVARRPVRSASA